MKAIAVIGCGRISKKHFEAIEKSTYFSLVAAADRDEEKRRNAAEKYNVPVYEDAEACIEQEKPDIVAICTEAGIHFDGIMLASSYGVDVIVEKPLCLSSGHGHALKINSMVSEIDVFVMMQNRFNDAVATAKAAVDDGRLGKINQVTMEVAWCRHQEYYDMDAWRGTWEMDGGVIASQACHHVDLLQWFLGPIKNVFCKTANYAINMEPEDTATSIWEAESGALGTFTATTAARPKNIGTKMVIYGSRGTIVIGGKAVDKILLWDVEEMDPVKVSENPDDIYGFGHAKYYNHVEKVCRYGEAPCVDLYEGLKTVELFNSMYASSVRNKPVYVRDWITNCGVYDDR